MYYTLLGADMKLKHYYHIYADGRWEQPLTDHITALNESGLMEALDFVGVGIVGCDENREAVKSALPPNFTVVIEACSGYEQITMELIDTSEPAYIFYAHTKGASNPDHLRKMWRDSMTNGTVYGWRLCVELLESGKYDAVGLYWQQQPRYHFSGTFWWATSDYISTLGPLGYSTRFDAEMWIGQGSKGGTFADLCPGFISAINLLKRDAGDYKPTTFPGHTTFLVTSKIAGYQRGKVYTVPTSQYIDNCIRNGHFKLIRKDDEPVSTFRIVR
jgi:hypothetical protein